jgi:hypothetical protein
MASRGIGRTAARPMGPIALVKPITDGLSVREIVDRHVPMERERDDGLTHGQVVEALVANRLSALYKVEDWASNFAVKEVYSIPAEKLNDDRVGGTLDAMYLHLELRSELCRQ